MYKNLINLFLGILFAITFTSCGLSGEKYEEITERTYEVKQPLKFSLKNTNGNVEITSWDKNKIKIIAKKEVRTNSKKKADKILNSIKVRTKVNKNNVSVKVVYPKLRFSLFGTLNMQVSFEVFVPKKTSVDIKLLNGSTDINNILGKIEVNATNGRVEAYSIKGDAFVKTTNGDISFKEIDGKIFAKTTNGSINIFGKIYEFELKTINGKIELNTVKDFLLKKDSKISSVNGSIKIGLHSNADLNIDAKTTNGEITTDIPILIESKTKNKLIGKINKGGNLIKLTTVNGRIEINKI